MTVSRDFELSTSARSELRPITGQVEAAVKDSGIGEGLCTVSVPHTTAGVLVNEKADPDVSVDLLGFFERLVPWDARFRHVEGNSDAHIKAVLAGSSVSLPVREGALGLGVWQGIYFVEFDGPRRRFFTVTCLGDPSRA